MDEEIEQAKNLAESIIKNYITIDNETRMITISFGSLEADVGKWLKDIIDSV